MLVIKKEAVELYLKKDQSSAKREAVKLYLSNNFVKVIIISLLLCITFVNANESKTNIYFTVGLWSKHFENGFNEKHNAFGLEVEKGKYGLSYLNFNNSFKNITNIITINRKYSLSERLSLKVAAGMQKGYCKFMNKCEDGEKNITPIFMPFLSYKKGKYLFEVIPPVYGLTAIKVSISLW